MFKGSGSCRHGALVSAMLAATAVSAYGQAGGAPPVKKQLPADERAFKVARANVEPDQRLAAMREFLKAYPKSSRAYRAQSDILKILIDEYPRRRVELDAEMKQKIDESEGSQDRANTEADFASQLAEAGSAGIELPQAEAMAKDAVTRTNEPDFNKERLATYAKFKVDAPKPAELHKEFATTRAQILAILADVFLKEGKQSEAEPLIAEAYKLDPEEGSVVTERGRLAVLRHDDALAITLFEQAQLLGELKASDRDTMMQLYRKQHNGSDAGFSEDMDARYEKLYPAPFTPGRPKPVAAGRTVLLELFTGSACPPCVGGDVAVDTLLQAYPRTEFVALSFDEHIPEPDPLTNPDSVARADFYDVAHTPNFVVDGELQEFYGGSRGDSKQLYDKLAAMVDTEAARQDGVRLQATASMSGSNVSAHATVSMPGSMEIAKELSAGKPVAAPAPALIVNFALVEDDIRYSGENGVRLHRMVVRALAKPANSGFPITAGATANFEASFDPAAISRSLVTYLDGYEERNEKFGKIKFISKDMTMHPEHLMIAVWVQDAVSRRILQATIVPSSSAPARMGAE